MTTHRPSDAEEEYMARENADRRRANALASRQQAEQGEQGERERLKALHAMHCPKCGVTLDTLTLQGVQIERCFSCKGTWLDAGELEQLAEKDLGVLARIFDAFRSHQ